MSERISIYRDNNWAGTGDLSDDNRITNCDAHLCRDEDKNLELYEAIEEAIVKGAAAVSFEEDGEYFELTWVIV